MTRLEKAHEAQRLRDTGLSVREVAERMGAKHKTVWSWLTDPDGSKLDARKRSYAGTCIDCGRPTNGNAGPGKAPERCQPCRHIFERTDLAHRLAQGSSDLHYTDERCFAAVRRVVAAHGGPVSKQRYDEFRRADEPSGVLLFHRFDTWWNLCDLAGVGHVNGVRRRYHRMTADDCVVAFGRVASALGHPPTIREYTAYRREHPELRLPSEPTIRMRAEGWKPLIEAWQARDAEPLKAAA